MPTCAFLSFRLGGTDGVSIVADRWIDAFTDLGFRVRTVAGEGPVDITIPDLAIGRFPDGDEGLDLLGASEQWVNGLASRLIDELAHCELVVVENLGTIPMNLPASLATARARLGLPTIWHHHDPAWQRARYRGNQLLPVTDPASPWAHVVINDATRHEFAMRGIDAVTIRNAFDVDAANGDRAGQRHALGVEGGERLFVHPVRAIARKRIDLALDIAAACGATYWLTGRAEEGYDEELERLLAAGRAAGVRVIHEPARSLADLYAACDAVLFPSDFEGFGNPPIEAAIHRRPAVVGHWPASDELRELGFVWFGVDQVAELSKWLEHPDEQLLDHNARLAAEHLSIGSMTESLRELLDGAGWLP